MGEPWKGSNGSTVRPPPAAWLRAAGLVLWAASAGAGAAQEAASCNGRAESAGFSTATTVAVLGGPHGRGETTRFSVEAGSFASLTIAVQDGATICNGAACDGASYTASADGSTQFTVTGRTASENGRVRAQCAADSAATAGDVVAVTRSAVAAGGTSADGIGAAIGAPAARTRSGGVVATRGGLRFAPGPAREDSGGTAAWAALDGRSFEGLFTGSGIEATLGADVAVGRRGRLGAILSHGRFDFSFAGAAVITEAFSYGPYAVLSLGGNWSLEGYLVYANPAYRAGGARFTSSRTSAGLKLNAVARLDAVNLTASAGVRGFSEGLPAVTIGAAPSPAHTVSSLTAHLGATAEFRPGSRVRPYLSLAGEYTWYDDGLGTVTEGFAPRAGAGVRIRLAEGDVTFQADVGELFKGTSDYGLSLTYHLEF